MVMINNSDSTIVWFIEVFVLSECCLSYIGVGQAGLAGRLISAVVKCSSGIPFFLLAALSTV